MSIFNNKEHFLHEHLTFLETTEIEGKNRGFNKFLNSLGICNKGNYWDVDHSNIDWDQVQNHHQFDFSSVSAVALSEWLEHSAMAEHEFLFTWLDWEDPIMKIKTIDFIRKWEYFYNAAIDGMVLTTIDGTFFMEFTDDWKNHLNSNFIIKPLQGTHIMSSVVKKCEECQSRYYKQSSQMDNLCPDCAHYLHGYKNCDHVFKDGRCHKCYWNGMSSDYINKLKRNR